MALPEAVETALARPTAYPVLLVELFFADGVSKLARMDFDLHLPDGTVWQGLGKMIGVSAVEQPTNEGAPVVALSLSGVDQEMVNVAIRSQILALNRPANVQLAIFDVVDGAYQYLDRITLFQGRMQDIKFGESLQAESGVATARIRTISCSLEVLFAANRARQRARFYSHEEQQRYYPNDLGLQFLPRAGDQTVEGPWTVVA